MTRLGELRISSGPARVEPWCQVNRLAPLKAQHFQAKQSAGYQDPIWGVEKMDSRQYRHAESVIGTIDLASVGFVGMCWARRERISGGNPLTWCNRFLRDGVSPSTSFTLMLRYSIRRVDRQIIRHFRGDKQIDIRVLTSEW